MTEEIIRFVVEHSPPNSAPVYFWLSANWDVMSIVLQFLLALFAVGCIYFSANLFSEMAE